MPHVSSSGGSGGGNSGGGPGGGGGTTGGGGARGSGQQQGDNGPGSGGSVPAGNNGPASNSGTSGNGGDDLGSTDEVKVFKDEGDGEDEKLSSSENLTEEKSSLIDLTESEEKSGGGYSSNKHASRSDHSHVFGKIEPNTHPSNFNVGYLVGPYGYANGASGPIPVSMAGKMGLGPGVSAGHAAAAAEAAARLSFFCHNGGSPSPGGDPLLAAVNAGHHHHHHHHQPPPAHMGIPPYQLVDAKAGSMSGLTRPPMYPFGTGQYPYPMLSPEMSQVAASWHSPSMYPGLSAASASASAAAAAAAAAAGFRSPYQPSAPVGPDFYSRFSPTGLIGPPPPPPPGSHGHGHGHGHGHHHAGLSPQGGGGQPNMSGHPAIVTPGPKQELGLGAGMGGAGDMNHRYRSQVDHKNNMNNDMKNNQDANNAADKKKPHIKKPLNAFMLYMKEMRAKVVAECTLKESAAINQILGRKWHSLSREEQAKYYEKARQERQLHMQLYPGWSARDNYGYGTKKKKRKKERVPVESGGNSMKKCRARYGLDQQSQWCKPCRRKKKCIRYMEAGGGSADGNQSDDNLGSCGSMGDAHTPPEEDDDHDHDHHHSNDPNDETEEDSIEHRSMSSPGALSVLSSLTSPGGGVVLPSPSTSVASPSVSVASPYVMQLQSPLTPHNHDGLSLPLPSPFEALKLLPPPSIAPNYHHRLQHHLSALHQVHNQTQPQLPQQTTTTPTLTPTSPYAAATSPPHPHTHLPALHHPAILAQHQLVPHQHQHQHIPVGTNPHDVNNPLSVNQLTGQCVVKTEPTDNSGTTQVVTANGSAPPQQRSIISVT